MDFEWDDAKAAVSERKHGVSFIEAMSVFADPLSLTAYDPDHSDDEDPVHYDGRIRRRAVAHRVTYRPR